MALISVRKRKRFLKLYEQGVRSKRISKELGICMSHVQRIIRSFDAGDFSWVECPYRHFDRNFTEEEKVRIVSEITTERRPYGIYVKRYNLPIDILRQWIRSYNSYGVCSRSTGAHHKDGSDDTRAEKDQGAGEEAQEGAGRDHSLQDILQGLCGKRDGSSKKKILRTVGECRRLGIPLRDCLARLGISSSTYHHWKRHEHDEPAADIRLADAIRAVQQANRWAYGARRMARTLVMSGVCEAVNHKRVARVMREFGLNSRIRRKRRPENYYRVLREHPVRLPDNILDRNFRSDRPMRKLVTDITYLPTREGWLYLAAVKDLFNNEIVSYGTSRILTARLAADVVESLVDRGIDLAGTLLHSDQGWTYTNCAYIGRLEELGVCQSMSRSGNCWDNACMENFFGLFKSETIKQNKELMSVSQMNELVDDYIYWYNNDRIQKGLGYLSPVNYRKRMT